MFSFFKPKQSHTTFQNLINNNKYWQNVETKAINLGSTILGGMIALQSGTISKIVGGTVTLGGYIWGYKTHKSFQEQINELQANKDLTDKKDVYFAQSDLDDFVNASMIDKWNVDIFTKKAFDGKNAEKISNSLNLEALVIENKANNGEVSYKIVGWQAEQSLIQLMCEKIGSNTYSDQIAANTPIIHLSEGEIRNLLNEKFGKNSTTNKFNLSEALKVRMLENHDLQYNYVTEQLKNFKPSFWSVNSYEQQIKNEKARLEDEYNVFQSIAAEYDHACAGIVDIVEADAGIVGNVLESFASEAA